MGSARLRPLLLMAAILSACQSTVPTPRYLVTSGPVVVAHGIEQCVALDPSDERGVWWWGPGRGGCGTRSTGPDLFRPTDARITALPATGELLVTYELEQMRGDPFQVFLYVDQRTMRVGLSPDALRVALAHRDNLAIPERP